tara:strand:- start:238 stop:492 length:255 start_codon:yes stop_codon:yes gene_type:complete
MLGAYIPLLFLLCLFLGLIYLIKKKRKRYIFIVLSILIFIILLASYLYTPDTPKPLTKEQIHECFSKNIFEIQNDPVCKQLTKE